MLSFLLFVIESLGLQLASLFGVFFVMGTILSVLESETQKNYVRSIGWGGILWTAWIGTPIHELGHIFFAFLFRHKIEDVALFAPNAATGELGRVDHSFNPKSLYQQIGNFFIGAAPTIFGAMALSGLLYVYLPNDLTFLQPIPLTSLSLTEILSRATEILQGIFTWSHVSTWQFWVFLYVSFCISSHMAPSAMDRKAMWAGFAQIVGVLLVVNFVCLLIGLDPSSGILSMSSYLSGLTALFLYAAMISACHFFLSIILLTPLKKRR